MVRPLLPHTRRERVANYGTTQRALGGAFVPLFMFSAEQSDSLTVYVDTPVFSIPPSAIGTADFRPFVRLDWGHGGAFASAEIEVTKRQRISVVGSSIEIKAFIKASPLATAAGFVLADVPAEASATFRAFMGEGLDGLTFFPTTWTTQFPGNAGLLIDRQARLCTLRAFVTGGVDDSLVYLLVFDQDTIPTGGETPIDAMPIIVPPGQSGMASLDLGQMRAFTHGVAWAVSSTPFANLLVTGANAFVVAELES